MGARVAVGLFVELSVFICYLDLRIIGLVRLRTGRVMVSCEDGECVEPHLPVREDRVGKRKSTLDRF